MLALVDVADSCQIVQTFEDTFWLSTAKEETKNEMNQSFYRKENLDFLYFQRPGTAS